MAKVIYMSELDGIKYLKQKDRRLAKVIEMVGDYSYVPYEDGYSFVVNQIIGQMLSAKVAKKISERLNKLCDNDITPNKVLILSDDAMRETGMSMQKVRYIKSLSKTLLDGNFNFAELKHLTDEDTIKKLTKLNGVGVWTAKMYLIFVLDRYNVLPYEDMAFLQAYSWLYKTKDFKKSSIAKKCKKWEPYSSLAARYLYKALDGGYTKNEFHLFK